MGFQKGHQRVGGVQKGFKHPLVAAKDLFYVGDVEAARKKIISLCRSEDESIALKACELVLAYSYGKPTQQIEHTGDVSILID